MCSILKSTFGTAIVYSYLLDRVIKILAFLQSLHEVCVCISHMTSNIYILEPNSGQGQREFCYSSVWVKELLSEALVLLGRYIFCRLGMIETSSGGCTVA